MANAKSNKPKKGGASRSPKSATSKAAAKPAGGSVPPSSAAIAGKQSSTPYIVGMVVLAGAIAALLYMRCGNDGEQPVTTNTAAPKPTQTAQANLPEVAPPPPPEEEEDAGVDAEPEPKATGEPVAAANGPAPGGGACANCGKGQSSSALESAIRSTAGLAYGCYRRALRAGAAEGSLNVSLSVGSTGALCGASITSDTVGDPQISQCVLQKFQSRSYPKPQSGCVVVNVPINFKAK